MKRLIQKIRLRRAQRQEKDERHLQELRLAFKSRFYAFRLLLQANNNALENMAAIEKALEEKEPFGMPFIKAKVTAVSVDVFRMIRNLKEIAPTKYARLDDRFTGIQQAVSRILSDEEKPQDQRFTIPFDAIDLNKAQLVGSKMAKLAELKNKTDLNIPDGFAITASAFLRFFQANDLQTEINRMFQSVDFKNLADVKAVSEDIEQLILSAEVPEDLKDAIRRAAYKLELRTGRPLQAAMRSSSLGEDLARTSFAGQYKSKLNIGSGSLIQAYKEIVASMYSFQANVYRYNCGLKDKDNLMCVGVMEMVEATAGGVVYSRNPLSNNQNNFHIYATWGLPKPVVDGSLPCDQMMIARKPPHRVIEWHIAVKSQQVDCSPAGGIQFQAVAADRRDRASLSPEQAKLLALAALKIERHFNLPQDIEWAVTPDQKIVILQCRPLKAVKETRRIHQDVPARIEDNSQLISGGTTVCSGSNAGPVFFVDSGKDFWNFPKGAVLVTEQALPRWAPLLDHASAVVSQNGSFAGHLANVAREYGVPAIFGLGEAVHKLSPGAVITVDATNGIIYKGRQEAILTRTDAKRNLIEGSPVYQTLAAVSRLIVPLHLLDPDAIEFNPANCRTMHDITRFIHEKSVMEMFSFGKEYHFLERASKQLLYKVPMHWWVLNLDDGFRNPIKGRYVRLEDIQSIPMLSLWEGITAIPWEGPPSVDGRGLMSVMFQATANRSLTASGKSNMTEKNYFMISRNFCSLTSRLGFHFSSVESIISDDTDENYVCFQYKGGAADFNRRHRRVHFLGGILETFGFTTAIKEDTLVARYEKNDRETMRNKLKIIGYLTMHSRQLDMIMSNNATVNYYRNKFKTDIEKISAELVSHHDDSAIERENPASP